MLQQTQVATVTPYYKRFLLRFPQATALAAAEEHDVLRMWEGLGYYRRARQMHQAAKRIVNEHGGQFPRDPKEARRLPGVGRYTAGAVLSIAFDAREPILEANTLRLFARLLAYRGALQSTPGQSLLWSAAEAILPRRGSGALNQALMELGSQVCTVNDPDCARCPVASLCLTNHHGLQALVPARALKAKIENVHEASVVITRGASVLLVQHGLRGRWAGLWDFPRFPLVANSEATIEQILAGSIERL